MIEVEGYSIEQYPSQNQIVISLPQTLETLTNTMSLPKDRRLELNSEELAIILGITKGMFERKE